MNRMRDNVLVGESGFARLRNRLGAYIAGRDFESRLDQTVIGVKGWVKLALRERGKIVRGSRRDGHNIWTNSGREYLALLMSIQTLPSTPFRADHMAYIGVGIGSQVEDAGVSALVSPVAYATGLFLAALDVAPTFPLTPVRTTVKYHRIFAANEITIAPGSQVNVTELGLYTDGGPSSSYAPGTRDLTLANAAQQAPNAYKSVEPVGKTDALDLEVSWEIRF